MQLVEVNTYSSNCLNFRVHRLLSYWDYRIMLHTIRTGISKAKFGEQALRPLALTVHGQNAHFLKNKLYFIVHIDSLFFVVQTTSSAK